MRRSNDGAASWQFTNHFAWTRHSLMYPYVAYPGPICKGKQLRVSRYFTACPASFLPQRSLPNLPITTFTLVLPNPHLHLRDPLRAISQHRHPRKKHQLTFLPAALPQEQSPASRMFVQSTVGVALLASLVAAQANLTFDPTTIDLTTRGLIPSLATCWKASNVLAIRSMVPSRV